MLDLATAKAHLRIEADETDEDPLIEAYLAASIDQVEQAIGLNLSERAVRGTAPGFDPAGVRLFRGPVQSIEGVEYDASDGTVAQLEDYRLIEGSALLLPAFSASWPATMDGPGTVRVDYIAGYPEGELPAGLKQAVLMLMAHYFANREAAVTGTIATTIPIGVEMLLGPYRPIGLG